MKKTEEQFKREFINEQLRPFGIMLMFSLIPIILSPLIWLWHSGDLALKFLITGAFVWVITAISGRIVKRFIIKAYEQDLAERQQRKIEEENKPKSGFLERLEEFQKSQNEQLKTRKR